MNYLSQNTSFITPEGHCSFRHFRDGNKIQVLTQKGGWANGVIRAYGRKPLHLHVFEPNHGDVAEIYASLDARWLQPITKNHRYTYSKQLPNFQQIKYRELSNVKFGLDVDDTLFSLEMNIFSGDEMMYQLGNKNYKVINIHKEFKSCDAWGIELKEDFFFTLSHNILFGAN